MCGLFGFSGKQPGDATKLRWLAVENQSRGSHSAGVYTMKRDKEKTRTLFKDVGSSTSLLDRQELSTALQGAYTVQGHTRAATVGVVSKANAHPFQFEYKDLVVGAHNGFVLDSFKGDSQWKRFGFEEKFDVDSMLIFAALSKTGDYNILPTIEGSIACTFQFPDKYNDILFLYQASGRELHFGFAPEGIYYSSERQPLFYIGCKNIIVIPYNTLVVLQEGAVLDILSMPKSAITMKPNARRDSWHDSMSAQELKTLGFDDLADTRAKATTNYGFGKTDYTKKNQAGQACQLPASITTTSQGTTKIGASTNDLQTGRENRDSINLLVQDVKSAIEAIVPDPLQFVNSTSYNVSDTSSCLMLVKLVSSTHKQALPAWLIYSQEDERIAGITALNGITVLKFPSASCGKKHKLILSCPVTMDDSELFSVEVDPLISRVMEVTLELPFPSSVKHKTKQLKSAEHDKSVSQLAKIGGSQLSLYTAGVKPSGSILPNPGVIYSALPNESVHTRLEGEKVNGKESYPGNSDGDGKSSDGVHRGEHNSPTSSRVGSSFMIPISNVATMVSILGEENRTFKFKDRVRKVLLSQEYSLCKSVWDTSVGDRINIKRLLSDAAILKLYDIDKWNTCYSLPYYAWKLAANMFDNYKLKDLQETDLYLFYKDLGHLAAGNKILLDKEVQALKKPELVRMDLIV